MQLFSPSPRHRNRVLQCGLLLQLLSRQIHVTLFVLVHVEIRLVTSVVNVRHDLLRLKKSMTRPVIGVELGANTLYLVPSPFEFSCDESCSDSVHSVVQIPAFRHSLLPESHVQIHGLVHTKLCESVELCQPGLRRFLSLRIVNKTVQQVSNVFVTVDVLILKSRYRNSSHRSSCSERPSASLHSSGCFACGCTSNLVSSAARLVSVVALS